MMVDTGQMSEVSYTLSLTRAAHVVEVPTYGGQYDSAVYLRFMGGKVIQPSPDGESSRKQGRLAEPSQSNLANRDEH